MLKYQAYRLQQKLWNGTNWTEVNDMGIKQDIDVAGSAGIANTAALAFGGEFSPDPVTALTETLEWNKLD